MSDQLDKLAAMLAAGGSLGAPGRLMGDEAREAVTDWVEAERAKLMHSEGISRHAATLRILARARRGAT